MCYVVYDLILIALACVSPELWITLLCALLSFIAAIRAITLFSSAILGHDAFVEKEFVLRINGPRH